MNISILGYDVVLEGRRTPEYCNVREQGCTNHWNLIDRATKRSWFGLLAYLFHYSSFVKKNYPCASSERKAPDDGDVYT
jgi:hypothetical protein